MTARPLIIVGASRSGTSVLAQLMGLHPRVREIGEMHFFEQFWAPSRQHETLTRAEAENIASRLLHHAVNGFYRPYRPRDHARKTAQLVDALAQPAGAADVYRSVLADCGGDCAWVIDKTPRYVTWIPEILLVLPDAIVAVITRDPRDVLLSQKRWYRALWKARKEVTRRIVLRHFLQYHPLTMSLLWRSAARADQRAIDPRVIHLRFEDLVTDTRQAIEPLLTAMCLNFDERMLEVARRGSSNRPGVRTGSGLDPEVVGLGRSGLSPTEHWINQRMCAQLMRRYGYFAEPARPSVWGILRAVISLPLRTIATLLMNIRRSRSIRQSVPRRLGLRRKS